MEHCRNCKTTVMIPFDSVARVIGDTLMIGDVTKCPKCGELDVNNRVYQRVNARVFKRIADKQEAKIGL